MPTRKWSRRFSCIKLTGDFCEQSKRHWRGSGRAHTEYAWFASSPFLRRASKRCLGRTFAASVRSDSPLNGGERTDNQVFSILGCPSPKLWPTAESTAYNNISN